jgi:ketosteroid isomerase-like protein
MRPQEGAVSIPVSRHVVETFYEAFRAGCAARDLTCIAPYVHNDVEWTISGPVEILPFCGTHRGKQAVLDMIGRVVPRVFQVTGFLREELLVDGDRACALSRIAGEQRETGATISFRLAQFVRFCGGKVINYRSLIDSFDAAEQVLGRHIALAPNGKPDLIGGPVRV